MIDCDSSERRNLGLQISIKNGDLHTFKQLFSQINETNPIVCTLKDGKIATVLHYAARNGQVEIIKYLAKHNENLLPYDNQGYIYFVSHYSYKYLD